MHWRFAHERDLPLLAEWNHQLIRDEGHRNPMTVEQLGERMRAWLAGEYKAVIFGPGAPLAYALYRELPEPLYLRQFFVARNRRREGIGRAAFQALQSEVWPKQRRLTVDVLTGNAAAIAFWRSVGFQDYALTLEISPPTEGLGPLP